MREMMILFLWMRSHRCNLQSGMNCKTELLRIARSFITNLNSTLLKILNTSSHIYPTLSGYLIRIEDDVRHKWSTRHQIRALMLMRNPDKLIWYVFKIYQENEKKKSCWENFFDKKTCSFERMFFIYLSSDQGKCTTQSPVEFHSWSLRGNRRNLIEPWSFWL